MFFRRDFFPSKLEVMIKDVIIVGFYYWFDYQSFYLSFTFRKEIGLKRFIPKSVIDNTKVSHACLLKVHGLI